MPELAAVSGPKTLVVDTCALLDIVRAPSRSNFNPAHLENARVMAAALIEPNPPVNIVVCNWVVGEYERGVEGVVAEVRQTLAAMWGAHRHAHEMMAVHQGGSHTQIDSEKWITQLLDHGKDVVAHFLRTTPKVAATAIDEQLATARTREARAPSHKGKGSLADAVVTELALRIARQVGHDGNGSALTILLSSNTKDFCDGTRLKPVLQQEFDSACLGFAATWSQARYLCLPTAYMPITWCHAGRI